MRSTCLLAEPHDWCTPLAYFLRGVPSNGYDHAERSCISSEHCERTITNALTRITGVGTVKMDIPGKQVRVEFDDWQVNVDQTKDVLQEEDYPVESVAYWRLARCAAWKSTRSPRSTQPNTTGRSIASALRAARKPFQAEPQSYLDPKYKPSM